MSTATPDDDGYPYDDNMTLGAARDWLRARIEHGATCPCCQRFAKVYRRKVAARDTRALIKIYRDHGIGWVRLRDLVGYNGGDEAKLRYWQLIEQSPEVADDGNPHGVGWWRLTPRGVAWVEGRVSIPKYARIYAAECLGLEGELVNVRAALGGGPFDYEKLMRGE